MAFANQERQKVGARELEWSDALADAARYHSCRMMALNFLDHIDPEFGELAQRLRVAGLDTSNVGENIFKAKAGDPARHAVDLWMKSPYHREVLLDPSYRWTGVGFAVAADGKYWFTQDFSGANPLPGLAPNQPPKKNASSEESSHAETQRNRRRLGSPPNSHSQRLRALAFNASPPASGYFSYTALPPTIVVAT